MTAASAFTTAERMMSVNESIIHVPGPNGLPGGYPVKVSKQEVKVMLSPNLTLEKAIQINEECMKFDGIEHIDTDGTVYFAESNMAILKETLGYECRRMPLSEVEEWAKELLAKYVAFVEKYK
jgi:hypothetical protein